MAEPLKPRRRARQEKDFRERLEHLRQRDPLDPKPLADLKNLLTEYDHALFTCLRFEGIPCDNNRAERDIRIVVKKRRKCFGSKTEAGAHAFCRIRSYISTARKNALGAMDAIARVFIGNPFVPVDNTT